MQVSKKTFSIFLIWIEKIVKYILCLLEFWNRLSVESGSIVANSIMAKIKGIDLNFFIFLYFYFFIRKFNFSTYKLWWHDVLLLLPFYWHFKACRTRFYPH